MSCVGRRVSLLRRLRDIWINFPIVDYPVVSFVAVVVLLGNPSLGLRSQDHGSFHQTLATVSGVLLTLGTIVITLIFTVTPNDRLQWVLQRVGPDLQRLVMRCLGGLVITTVGFTGLFLLEKGVDPRSRIIVTAGLAIFASLRFLRLWWLLSRVLEALASGNSHTQSDIVSWQQPVVKPNDYRLRQRKSRHKKE